MTSPSEKDTFQIEFKDSVYHLFEYDKKPLSYSITSYKEDNILILENGFLMLTELDEQTYDGVLITDKAYPISLEEKTKPWTKEMLLGKWYLADYYNTKVEDLPPWPLQFDQDNLDWPPYYILSEKSIALQFYKRNESEIDVNSNVEYINMDLIHPIDGTEYKWKIKTLNDSLMIINKKILNPRHKFEFESSFSEDIILIKSSKDD